MEFALNPPAAAPLAAETPESPVNQDPAYHDLLGRIRRANLSTGQKKALASLVHETYDRVNHQDRKRYIESILTLVELLENTREAKGQAPPQDHAEMDRHLRELDQAEGDRRRLSRALEQTGAVITRLA